ncbi:RNA polymerase sigma factor [Bacillus sp. JJ1533]|uniref:RNA polymerase sigma factor n=1 Tax=Bacillus sp. JJ1533 TaxID=3122959 RepID=UPI002FFE70E1
MIFENLELEVKKLYKYCLKLSSSPWLAEDLAQETMLKVIKLKHVEPKREFTFSFLCVVAKNLFIDEKRKNKEQIHFNEDLYGVDCDSIEYYGLIEILLSALPLKQAMLVTLKDVFGYTSKEIAVMLRVSDESIKTALHRSRRKLKSDLDVNTGKLTNHEIVVALTKAIVDQKPIQIFFYYRLLETRNFHVRRKSSEQSVFHVIDPDGNIVEFVSQ